MARRTRATGAGRDSGVADRRDDLTAGVHHVVSSLALGELATYGEVAARAGRPGAARAVGSVIARSDGLPWWRVVTSTGRLVPGHEAVQSARLADEGVATHGNRVVGFGRRPRSRRR